MSGENKIKITRDVLEELSDIYGKMSYMQSYTEFNHTDMSEGEIKWIASFYAIEEFYSRRQLEPFFEVDLNND